MKLIALDGVEGFFRTCLRCRKLFFCKDSNYYDCIWCWYERIYRKR